MGQRLGVPLTLQLHQACVALEPGSVSGSQTHQDSQYLDELAQCRRLIKFLSLNQMFQERERLWHMSLCLILLCSASDAP